jgi:uncharacterized damage-inducible protein DinB/heme-degrading monooxygenase HmoA
MIARLWHGWTSRENADAYETLLKSEILPGLHRVPGYHGAHLMRRDAGPEAEFVTLTLFDSLDAVRAFAGADYERAVILPEARRLLAHFDERSVHYRPVARLEDGAFGKDALKALHAWTHGSLDVLFEHARALSADAFRANVPGIEKSVRGLMAHVLVVEEAWVCNLRNEPVPKQSEEDYPTIDAVMAAKRCVMEATIAYLDALTDAQLNTELERVPDRWVGPRRTPAFILLHVITHAFHHKGQIALMLRMLGHPAPDSDLQRDT